MVSIPTSRLCGIKLSTTTSWVKSILHWRMKFVNMAVALSKCLYMYLVALNYFMSQSTNISFYSHFVANIYLIVCVECSLVHIWQRFHITKSLHYEHIFVSIPMISRQIFKVDVIVSEVCMPTPIEHRMTEDCHIMERTGKIQVQVNEKTFVKHHLCIVHTIHCLPAIKPLYVVEINPRLPILTNTSSIITM